MPKRLTKHRPARPPIPKDERPDDVDRARWRRNNAARPSASAQGYGRKWQRIRAAVLRAEPMCRACREAGRLVEAQHVDHIKPKADGGTDDRENLQPLCPPCHSRKTAGETAARRGGA